MATLALAAAMGAQTATRPAGTVPAMNEVDRQLAKLAVFPKDDLWNKDISQEAVDPKSGALIGEIGAGKALHPDWGKKYGIPFQLVDVAGGKTPRVMPKFDYPDESEKGRDLEVVKMGVVTGG